MKNEPIIVREQNGPMGELIGAHAEIMASASPEMRHSILSGMRWTFWLSAMSVPFSFVTSILLARVGPEVIGTFGLLQIYIGVVACFFFLGGNAVAIKFLPELKGSERFSFLASYFVIICMALVPWLIAVTIWPQGLRYLFGKGNTGIFWVFFLYLTPVYVIYSLSLASLKGMLQIKWAQGLDRLVTVGSFSVYVVLFFAARGFFAVHYRAVIWGIYLCLVVFVAVLALRRFLRLNHWRENWRPLRFFLPGGFWKYTLGLQAGSVLGFFTNRLDYLFLLYAGGVALLGRYVALMSLFYPISKVASFALDSLLPSLTNTLARKDYVSSRELTETYIRIMVPSALIVAGFMVFFAKAVVLLLGPRYRSLEQLIWVGAPFAVVAAMNWFTGIMLSACGRPDCDAYTKILRLALFVALFWPMYHRYALLGAILTWGVCEVFYHIVSLYWVRRIAGFRFGVFQTYWPAIAMLVLLPIVQHSIGNASWILSLILWVVMILLFFWLAGYSVSEIRKIVKLFLPGSWVLSSRPAE
ncbi:MAG: lipopolysaccharide biosynthesis protein [Candidatus Acidiferrales bacterium]